ncbi:hypothetical protein [Candidatus Frankia alpina]|uniref:hypothetical protein n=1 Tax=Candidatus Frankia alpina TaxID=2699483 RepID=UPI0013D0D1D1|nr:hypothetical protein [Candidatus Frankia alpina]
MTGFPDPEGLAVMVADRHLGPRPCHDYDYDYLGSFTSWPAAHEWAHLQAAMGGVPGPLEVEDRQLGQRRRVWVDRCADLLAAAETPAGSHAPRAVGSAADHTRSPIDHAGSPADHASVIAPLGAAVLCDVLDAPTVIPVQPRRSG